MSKRAIDFVERWIANNIHPQKDVRDEANDGRSVEFAEICQRDAAQQGIPETEIEEEFLDLPGRMADAINETAEDEIEHH